MHLQNHSAYFIGLHVALEQIGCGAGLDCSKNVIAVASQDNYFGGGADFSDLADDLKASLR